MPALKGVSGVHLAGSISSRRSACVFWVEWPQFWAHVLSSIGFVDTSYIFCTWFYVILVDVPHSELCFKDYQLSAADKACEELINLMECGGLKSPTGLFGGCSQGSVFFPGTASGYMLEECNDTLGSYIRPALTSVSGACVCSRCCCWWTWLCWRKSCFSRNNHKILVKWAMS